MWILNHIENVDLSARDGLLAKGGLLKFADVSRALSEVWLGGREPDDLSCKMQDFLLRGGVYGSTDNRVALQQKKRGGRLGYIISRLFIPYDELKRCCPVLENTVALCPLCKSDVSLCC